MRDARCSIFDFETHPTSDLASIFDPQTSRPLKFDPRASRLEPRIYPRSPPAAKTIVKAARAAVSARRIRGPKVTLVAPILSCAKATSV